MELSQFVSTAKAQISWEKYKRSYSHVEELDALSAKLKTISLITQLSLLDVKLLKKITQNSIQKVSNYDYGDLQDKDDTLRNEALSPLYEFMSALTKLEKGELIC